MKTIFFSLSLLFLASCMNNNDKPQDQDNRSMRYNRQQDQDNGSYSRQQDQNSRSMRYNGQEEQQMQRRSGCDGSCCPHKCTKPKCK